MAKRLSAQKRDSYQCPPKACPAPADLLQFPEIMNRVRAEWRRRMEDARNRKRKA